MIVTETFMDEIAIELGIDPTEVREKNLYDEDDRTFFSQKLENCTLKRCWAECKTQSKFVEQKKQVEEWNASNKWRKRGIAMIPSKFGIAFSGPHMNKGGALIQVRVYN